VLTTELTYSLSPTPKTITASSPFRPFQKNAANLVLVSIPQAWATLLTRAVIVTAGADLRLRDDYCTTRMVSMSVALRCEILNSTAAQVSLLEPMTAAFLTGTLEIYIKLALSPFSTLAAVQLTATAFASKPSASGTLIYQGLGTLAVASSSMPRSGLIRFVREDYASRLCSVQEQCEISMGIRRYFPGRVDEIRLTVHGLPSPAVVELSSCRNFVSQFIEIKGCRPFVYNSSYTILFKPDLLTPTFNIMGFANNPLWLTGPVPTAYSTEIAYYQDGLMVEYQQDYSLPVKGLLLTPAQVQLTVGKDFDSYQTMTLCLGPVPATSVLV
jgi:hypothetical protein